MQESFGLPLAEASVFDGSAFIFERYFSKFLIFMEKVRIGPLIVSSLDLIRDLIGFIFDFFTFFIFVGVLPVEVGPCIPFLHYILD